MTAPLSAPLSAPLADLATPIASLHTFDLFGFYLPAFVFWCLVALLPHALLRQAFAAAGLYRFVWHRALFDTALYVLVLWAIVLGLGGEAR